jgi:hypothetical protein
MHDLLYWWFNDFSGDVSIIYVEIDIW